MTKFYKQVSNYVANELQFTKQYVFDYIDQRLDKFLKDYIEQRSYRNAIELSILNEVANQIQAGFKRSWYDKSTFEDYVKKCVKEEVQKKVDQMVDINISFRREIK